MTINELRTKRNQLWESTKAFLEAHRNEKGVLSAEDDAAYTRMEQDIADLGKEITRMERQQAMDAELNRPVNKPLTARPDSMKEDTKTGTASDAYKKAFWENTRHKDSVTPEMKNTLREGLSLIHI